METPGLLLNREKRRGDCFTVEPIVEADLDDADDPTGETHCELLKIRSCRDAPILLMPAARQP